MSPTTQHCGNGWRASGERSRYRSNRTRASWLDAHERLFRRYLPTLGITYHPELTTIFE